LRKITRVEPLKNPNKKEKPTKEKAIIEKITKENIIVKETRKKEKEKEKLIDKPETPKKKNLKYKANKAIRNETKDPNTLI
jgi:hypothetical protein